MAHRHRHRRRLQRRPRQWLSRQVGEPQWIPGPASRSGRQPTRTRLKCRLTVHSPIPEPSGFPAHYSKYSPASEKPTTLALNYRFLSLTNLTWMTWGPDGADGTGVENVQINCDPTCAEGSRYANPVSVHATAQIPNRHHQQADVRPMCCFTPTPSSRIRRRRLQNCSPVTTMSGAQETASHPFTTGTACPPANSPSAS